jgi:hypothetical protein
MWSTSLNRLFPQEKAYIANPGHMTPTVLLLQTLIRNAARKPKSFQNRRSTFAKGWKLVQNNEETLLLR